MKNKFVSSRFLYQSIKSLHSSNTYRVSFSLGICDEIPLEFRNVSSNNWRTNDKKWYEYMDIIAPSFYWKYSSYNCKIRITISHINKLSVWICMVQRLNIFLNFEDRNHEDIVVCEKTFLTTSLWQRYQHCVNKYIFKMTNFWKRYCWLNKN